MNPSLHSMASYRRAVVGLLLPAFLLLAFFPFHYHLHPADAAHHDGGLGAHGHAHHTTDLHVLTDIDKVAHHADSHTIDPGADLTFKSAGPQLPPFVLAFVLLLLIVGAAPTARFTQPPAGRPSRLLWRSSPPLRAPPRA